MNTWYTFVCFFHSWDNSSYQSHVVKLSLFTVEHVELREQCVTKKQNLAPAIQQVQEYVYLHAVLSDSRFRWLLWMTLHTQPEA